jgi:CRP/FNR family transcriptional regulator, cyclic AMP receptor protein
VTGPAVAADGLEPFIQRVFACSPDVAVAIARRAVEKGYGARTVIIRQGDDCAEAYLLIAGRAHALLYGAEGQSVLLHEFVAGDIFGAVVKADRSPEEADVVAVEDVRAALFLAMDFLALIEAHGCVGLALSRMLLRRLRTATERMVERVTLSVAGRVHAELLRLARTGDGVSIRPFPVISALAVRVQSTRESVSRTISDLERRGLIRRDADALVILAPHRLEAMIV